MKKMIFPILLAALFAAPARAQDGCEISIKMNGYHYDTLWLGAFYGKRTSPIFGVRRQPDGRFLLKKSDGLAAGLYAVMAKRNEAASFEYLPCWILDGQRTFGLEADFNQLKTAAKAINSPENGQLFAYFAQYEALTDSLDDRTFDWKSAQDGASFEKMTAAERSLQLFQDEIIAQNPASRTAKLIAETRFLTADGQRPTADGRAAAGDWRDRADVRLKWQREHFFDRMNLKSDDLLSYPLWVDRLDYFAFKLSEPTPESMIGSIENLLARMDPSSPVFQYYFRYIMQSLGRITRFRTDEVYVHFTKKYVDGGLVNWVKTADIERYRDDAARLEPLFVGKKAPNVSLFDKAGQPFSIYRTEAEYLLLVFWMHDCSHCKREIPLLESIYKKYQTKGLKVISVCGKTGEEEMPKCWEFADRMAMPADWILAADPAMKSDFRASLNIRSFPRMILLDKNKVILYKQAGELSEEVMEREFARAVK